MYSGPSIKPCCQVDIWPSSSAVTQNRYGHTKLHAIILGFLINYTKCYLKRTCHQITDRWIIGKNLGCEVIYLL